MNKQDTQNVLRKKPKLIFGDDNGECSLWDITLGEYEMYRKRIDAAYSDGNDRKGEKLEGELNSHLIKIDTEENGYVPYWATYLAKTFGLDTESN